MTPTIFIDETNSKLWCCRQPKGNSLPVVGTEKNRTHWLIGVNLKLGYIMSGKLLTICHCERSEAIAETRRLLRFARNDKYLTGHDIKFQYGSDKTVLEAKPCEKQILRLLRSSQ